MLKNDVARNAWQKLEGVQSAKRKSLVSPRSSHYMAGLSLIAIVVFSYSSIVVAAEVASFRTTSVESSVELRYLFDERSDTSGGVTTLDEQQSTYEEEFSVLTRNYVYHPNFLKLDLGAGLTFKQNSFEANTGVNKENDELYSLLVRASLLEKKPYPVSFNFTRDNPVTYSGLAERLQQENIAYVLNFSLLEPFIPLKLNFYASHLEEDGGSVNELVDETTDKYGMRGSKEYSESYSQQFSFDHTGEDSGSGNLALPITPTVSTTDLLTYGSDWRFGETKQHRYSDRLRLTRQEGLVDREEVNFSPSLVWQHSDRAKTFYRYDFLDSSVNFIDTTNQAADASYNYKYSEQTVLDTGINVENNTTTGLENRSIGLTGNIDHNRSLTNGNLTLIAALDYSQNDRVAAAAQASVIGETITLAGLTPVSLIQPFIITGSIVVQNIGRTQTYIDGFDYRVIVVGSGTEIQRLSGSNIGDPETVVVDYSYQTGGSAGFSDLTQNYSANMSINRYNRLYIRYRKVDQNLTSGNPTLPLNSQDRLSLGAGTEYPLSKRIEIGANVDLVKHEEDISPYDSQRYGAYGQFILARSSNLRMSFRQEFVDNLNSLEDVDLTRVSVIYRARPRKGMTLTAEAYTEEDTGGTLTRERDSLRFTARWQIFRLTMNLQATFTNETTGATETERVNLLLTLRRDI